MKKLLKKITKYFIDLWEKIFRKKELEQLKKDLKMTQTLLDNFRDKTELLTKMNTLLTTGEQVQLTQRERTMILFAIEFRPFKEVIQEPRTKREDRDTYRNLREKIKASLKDEAPKNTSIEEDETAEVEVKK